MSLCIWSVCHTQTEQNLPWVSVDWLNQPDFPVFFLWVRSPSVTPSVHKQVTCIQTESSYECLLHKNTAALQYYNTRGRQRERKNKEMRETRRTQKVVLLFLLNIKHNKAKTKKKTTITLSLHSYTYLH